MRWGGPSFRSEFGDFSSCKSEIALFMRFRCQNQSLTYVSRGTELLEVYLGLRRSKKPPSWIGATFAKVFVFELMPIDSILIEVAQQAYGE